MTEPHTLPDGLIELLPGFLGRQRWYAGDGAPETLDVLAAQELWGRPDGVHRLLWAVVGCGGGHYQLLIGERPGGEPADFLNGHESGVVGSAGATYFYDATLDPEMGPPLLELVTAGSEEAAHVRPVSAEQSNTSLIFDDRVIVKFFRRLVEGPNPEVEVTQALAGAGFTHVARPVGVWHRDSWDLAVAQEFLAGGSEGWALALTSLRDYYDSTLPDPADAGGDFAGEAGRLGAMTAEMHLAMAASFGTSAGPATGPGSFSAVVADIERRLDAAADLLGRDLRADAEGVLARLRAVRDPGPLVRVHGDYHLGQVMRTDAGWYVLDFEGEPARSREERARPAPALKDVTAMLRSFHYAARFALTEWDAAEAADLEPFGRVWEAHNRVAFVRGYRQVPGIDALLPPPEDAAAVEVAWEMDKALYELDYELAYRPAWVSIPLDAIARLAS